jgi:hypothetical protein
MQNFSTSTDLLVFINIKFFKLLPINFSSSNVFHLFVMISETCYCICAKRSSHLVWALCSVQLIFLHLQQCVHDIAAHVFYNQSTNC